MPAEREAAEDLNVILVNAWQVKNLPGRKTDVSDAAWPAQLGAHGLVRPSFVPPQPVCELRDLTRARTTVTRERGHVVQRLEKLLEDTGIKLAVTAGERDPQILAEPAKRRLRNKMPELTEALPGRFREHRAFLLRLYLDQHDQLTGRIEEAMAPFRGALDLLDTIPGVNQTTAEVIIAETGGDMTRFAFAKHLASWAGVCPGHHESAGRTKNTKVRPGSPYLKGAPRLRRSTRREPRTPICVAVEHSIINAA